MGLEAGRPVRVEMEKWGRRPHWAFDAVFLGSDAQGDWIGIPVGTPMSRPGAQFVSQSDQVGLVPSFDLDDDRRWWIATFHAPGGPQVSVYVDIASPPQWDGPVVRTVDLDLDVVRGSSGRVWIDDEDEFAQHKVDLGYPDDVVASAMRSCDLVEAAVAAGHPPYDGSHERWLAVLAAR